MFENQIETPTEEHFRAIIESQSMVIPSVRERMKEKAEALLESMKASLRIRLGKWEPSEESLAFHPFLSDVQRLGENYSNSIRLQDTEDGFEIVCDTSVLEKMDLPDNLPELLEYGSELIPPFPHLRIFIREVTRELESIGPE